MSYFTVIEDFSNVTKPIVSAPFVFSFLDNFKDYSSIAIAAYVLFILLIFGIYSRGKDLADWKILYKMNDSEEKTLEIQEIDDLNLQAIKKEDEDQNKDGIFSLITFIFKRKLQIEPYCV